MSDYMEIINPRTMTCSLMKNGTIVETYRVEQCQNCSMLVKFDEFGYKKDFDGVWFCAGCR